MKKIMASIMMAGLALVPVLGLSEEAPAPTPIERATKAAASAETLYQEAKAVLVKAQQEADLATANLARAKEDLKIAETAGDKEKIEVAKQALRKAVLEASERNRIARSLARQTERLKMLADKAKQAVVDAGSSDPKAAAKAADDAEALLAKAVRIAKTMEEIMKPRDRPPVGDVTIPTTTTSTTQPSPTPVGNRG